MLQPIADLPDARDCLPEVREAAAGGRLALFLDFDGTLAPIVERPQDARLSAPMAQILGALATRLPMAIVSGRDLEDVRGRSAVPGAWHAGSHGYRIASPDGVVLEKGTDYLDDLQAVEAAARDALAGIAGVRLERKSHSLAVHFRQVAEADHVRLEALVRATVNGRERLRLGAGKMVWEIRPTLDWHKGAATLWLLARFEQQRGSLLPLFIGDDITDEDGFEAVRGLGAAIIVGHGERLTAAAARLDSPAALEDFLKALPVPA